VKITSEYHRFSEKEISPTITEYSSCFLDKFTAHVSFKKEFDVPLDY
tara:strand:- start:237 stop:377 length:141 start_codon:yes stop_codon:yes gene_type:complete